MDIELLHNDFKDKELQAAEVVLKDICTFLKGRKDISNGVKTKYFEKRYKELGKMISKRFGLNFDFRTDLACGACTVSLSPEYDSNISRNASTWKRESEKALASGNLSKKERKFLENFVDQMKYTRQNLVEGVTVDLKKAKVYGMKKKVVSSLYLDFPMLIGFFNLTAKEIFAIMLHEVGHSFSSLMYIKKVSYNSISHEESLTKWLGGDTSNMKIKLGKKETDLSKPSSNKDIAEHVKFNVNTLKHAHADSEREADRFVTTFGYSEYLASSLMKMHDIDPKRSVYLTTSSSFSNTLISSIYLFLYVPLIIPAIILGEYLIWSVLLGLVTAIFAVLIGTEDSNKTTYDSIPDRLEKIKRNMVRSLREGLVLEDQVKTVIAIIESTEETINRANIESSLGETLYNYFSTTANTTSLYRTLETLSENDLHYLKEKL